MYGRMPVALTLMMVLAASGNENILKLGRTVFSAEKAEAARQFLEKSDHTPKSIKFFDIGVDISQGKVKALTHDARALFKESVARGGTDEKLAMDFAGIVAFFLDDFSLAMTVRTQAKKDFTGYTEYVKSGLSTKAFQDFVLWRMLQDLQVAMSGFYYRPQHRYLAMLNNELVALGKMPPSAILDHFLENYPFEFHGFIQRLGRSRPVPRFLKNGDREVSPLHWYYLNVVKGKAWESRFLKRARQATGETWASLVGR